MKNKINKAHLLVFGLVLGLIGIFPHLLLSIQNKKLSYLINSYDEGYYGYDALIAQDLGVNRGLSQLILFCPYKLIRSCEVTFFVLDFIFPALVGIVCYYMFSLLFRDWSLITLCSICFIFAPELFCNRSDFVPTWVNSGKFIGFLLENFNLLPAKVFINNNQTGTFWLFRTPEPQISQLLAYFCLFISLKSWLDVKQQNSLSVAFLKVVVFFLLPFGYVFVVLPFILLIISGCVSKFGLKIFCKPEFLALFFGGLTKIILSLVFPEGLGTAVFSSHLPAFTLSCLWGLLGILIILIRRQKKYKNLLAIFFGLSLPIIVCNQQIVSGKMIMLNNFENFSLPQIAFFSLIIAFKNKAI